MGHQGALDALVIHALLDGDGDLAAQLHVLALAGAVHGAVADGQGVHPGLFEELNGGILLQEEAKLDPMFPEGEVYFMGEYVQDGYLGRYINLYYGSFLASARNEDWDEETWKEELYTTLAHELTHHVEGLANAHGLDDKDEEQLLRMLEEYQTEFPKEP